MTKPAPHYTEQLESFGRRLFGEEWGAAMARLTNTNPRTITRIRTAAREGRDYPAARGVLAALYEALQVILADLKPHGRR